VYEELYINNNACQNLNAGVVGFINTGPAFSPLFYATCYRPVLLLFAVITLTCQV
jgi:hypothetical protein